MSFTRTIHRIAVRFGLTFAIGALLAADAVGKDWYIDVNAAPGGNGSAAAPYQKIDDGLHAAVNGDRLLVAAGTYAEALTAYMSVTIVGDRAGGTVLDAGMKKTALVIASGKTVWVQDLEITRGVNTIGGGVSNRGTAIFVRCRVTGCSASAYGSDASGGGISNHGTMLLWGCSVDACSASSASDFIYHRGGSASGAGISSDGTLKIFNSTIHDNVISTERGAGGGGIANKGTLRLVNATVSGNRCSGTSASGGGILSSGTSVLIDHSTIAANSVSGHDAYSTGYADGGGFEGFATVSHSIFDGNSGYSDQPWGVDGPDFCGTCDSLGYLLIKDDEYTTITGDLTGVQTGISAVLLALADNGGLVMTHALDPTSPCIDSGSPDSLASPAYDGRGYPRALWDPTVGPSDLGAYEYGSAPSFLLTATPDIPLAPNAIVELCAGGGTGFHPLLLAVVAVNGSPVFIPGMISSFDQSGVFVLEVTVPSGLSGSTAGLRSFSLDVNDKVEMSNEALLTFQ